MPPKKMLAVEGKAGPSRGARRGAPSAARASAGGARGRGRGRGRGTAARGSRSSAGAGNMGDSFLGKLTQNPAMMGEFLNFFGKLDKALEKRDKKNMARRLGLGDDEEDEDSGDEDSPGDDLDGWAHRALGGMAAKMGGVSDLRAPGAPRPTVSSDDDSDRDSDDDQEMDEAVYAMTSEEESSSDDEAEPAQPAAARVKYVRFRDEEFAAAVAGAPRIARLSLAKLIRTRKDAGVFGNDPKRDKHIEAVLKALGGATKDVAALHLDDAEWATCKMYSPMLVRLLASYKQSLRTLSMTNRLLLQPDGKKKNCIWKVVSSMPHLEELRLTYVALSLHYYTYGGELRKDDYVPATLRAKTTSVLPALKRIHLYLTPDWFERQFRAAIDGGSDYEDFEYESAGGGEREEEQEDFLEDLLTSRGDAVTVLDMTCVKKTHMELEIVDLLAGLPNVRSIGLRVELLRVTKQMARLATVCVAFHHDPAPEDGAVAEAAALIAAGPASWSGLEGLTLQVPSKAAPPRVFSAAAPKRVRQVQASWNQVLTAAAGTCRLLKSLTLEGRGWAPDALQQVLAQNPSLETVVLDETGELLEPHHLALLRDMAALKRVQLGTALRDAKEGTELAALVAQCQEEWTRRGVRVQWGKKAAGRV